MDIYIARQPIFNRDMSIFGYELLHRRNSNEDSGRTDRGAEAELVRSSLLKLDFDNLTDGTRGFVNFTQDLLEAGIPNILHKEKVIVEIPGAVEATDAVIAVCRSLKDEGYILALDDFVFGGTGFDHNPLLGIADMIKIDFPGTDKEEQRELIRQHNKYITFLARRVETRAEFQETSEMGYELFQGSFFSKPATRKSKEVSSLNYHLIEILKELQKRRPDFLKVTEIIERDLGLAYKFLKTANSIYYGAKCEITDLHQAVVRFGIQEMKRWISILLIKEFENDENRELIKVCMLRGRLLSLLSHELKHSMMQTDFFFTGIFSSLDIIMDQDMKIVISDLALSDRVKHALLGKKGVLRECLDLVLLYERLEFEEAMVKLTSMDIDLGRFTELYIEALSWQKTAY